MKKASAISPANIAFVKHWGLSAEGLPLTGSLSMNLNICHTRTTVEFLPNSSDDEMWLSGEKLEANKGRNAEAYRLVKEFRAAHNIQNGAKIVTQNSFLKDLGIASSASGFSALTCALLGAAEVSDLEKNQWIACSGSYSAMRSLANDFGIYEPPHAVHSLSTDLQLVDLIVGTCTQKKSHTSLEGHRLASTSPLQNARLQENARNLKRCENALRENDFEMLSGIIENEAWMLHAVMLTSQPALIYLEPKTIEFIRMAQVWKSEISFAITLDAGPTVHMIVEEKNLKILREKVENWGQAAFILEARPCTGTRLTDEHLF